MMTRPRLAVLLSPFLLLLTWFPSLSSAFSLSHHASSTCSRPKTSSVAAASNDSVIDDKDDDVVSRILFEAATKRTIPSSELLPILERLEDKKKAGVVVATDTTTTIPQNLVEGTYELVYSSAVANLPLVGSFLDGYLPNKETIHFDLTKNKKLSLQVETFPLLPSIDIEGENLTYNESTSTLTYTIKGKDATSTWEILYADETLLAAKSSVTGLNIIKRI